MGNKNDFYSTKKRLENARTSLRGFCYTELDKYSPFSGQLFIHDLDLETFAAWADDDEVEHDFLDKHGRPALEEIEKLCGCVLNPDYDGSRNDRNLFYEAYHVSFQHTRYADQEET